MVSPRWGSGWRLAQGATSAASEISPRRKQFFFWVVLPLVGPLTVCSVTKFLSKWGLRTASDALKPLWVHCLSLLQVQTLIGDKHTFLQQLYLIFISAHVNMELAGVPTAYGSIAQQSVAQRSVALWLLIGVRLQRKLPSASVHSDLSSSVHVEAGIIKLDALQTAWRNSAARKTAAGTNKRQ